ncbi:UNVERIFIED_CONTAM: hypothetical protein Sradi_6840200 [Sesamum radiatum]|uniref:Reverse transcriptase zinc-binding domain-containing protein n=1 Tax=Sesamum radiatum TaxID=300843 RepID=A0AAW2JLL6_SESRA
MEIWHVLLKIRTQTDECFQHHWKCKELGILNLCFADDVLIFCAGTINSVRTIKATLMEFAAMSGLYVNPGKSTIILSKSVRRDRQGIIDLMGFQEGSLPIKYLGVPLTSSRLTTTDCQPLLDKFAQRLAGWNHLTLSFAGRTQVIKSVLSSLHVYWASAFMLPKSIIQNVERKMREFVWKGSSVSGCAKVSWAQVCKPKEQGGLGIRSVLHMNQAMMMKHVWRILQRDNQSLWVAWVIRYKLRSQSIWAPLPNSASWCWKKLAKISKLMQAGLVFSVGDGCTFRLWTDPWHPRGLLLSWFPRGPAITGLPADSLLCTVMHQGQWCWPSSRRLELQGIVAELPPIGPQQSDVITWKSGNFNTKSVLSLIQSASSHVLWHHLLGGKFKIPRHDFILWLALWGRLSTMDRIRISCSDVECILCGGRFLETHAHLFFECSFSKRCIDMLKARVRFQWLQSGWNHDIIWASRRWRGKHLINAASVHCWPQ